jgi:flagellar biogenesis protein FliO
MSARRLSGATALALLVFAYTAAGQSADTSAVSTAVGMPRAPTAPPTMPTMPTMPTGMPAAEATSDVVATPFGPVSRSGASVGPAVTPHVVRAPSVAAKPAAKATGADKTEKTAKTAAKETAPVVAAVEAPPPPVESPAVASAPTPVPAASSAPRPWLRDKPKAAEPAQTKEEKKTSPWGAFAALLVLAVLGGGALVMRQRRQKAPGLPPGATRILVLSSAKIGPKASAVVAEVNGRVFLLGVTDSSVSKLAILDGGPRTTRTARARDDIDEDTARAALLRSRRAPVETAELEDEPVRERPISTKFGEMLDRALGVKPPPGIPDFRANPGVAALLANEVEDIVETSSMSRGRRTGYEPRPDPRAGRIITAEIIEDQVAGLSRKRRRA